jgi:uroporphyrinogen-III decarboxylase
LRTSEKERVQYLALMADELTARASVQGNLDPLLLVAGGKVLVRRTHEILTVLSGKRFIFNLGHGIVPDRRRISVLP